MDLLSLPFDQYQRYRLVADLVEAWGKQVGRADLSVLDVGGFARAPDGEPYLPMAQFLPGSEVRAYDLQPWDHPHYQQIGEDPNRFPSSSADIVVTCDVLEHLPQESRGLFLEKILGTARHVAVLMGPVDTELTNRSDRIVNLFHRSLTGEDHPWLAEHIRHRLPSGSTIRRVLEERSLQYEELHSGNVYRWLLMMLTKMYAQTLPEFSEIHVELDRFYNRYFHTADQVKPGYRRVFVIATSDEGLGMLEVAKDLARRAKLRAPKEDQGREVLQLINTALVASRASSRETLVDGRWQYHTVASPVWGDHSISFEMVCPANAFCRLDLYLATYGRRVGKPVLVDLEDADDATRWSHRANLPAPSVIDNYWHSFRFPEVVASARRRYRITLRAPELSEQTPITAYCGEDGVPAHRVYCAVEGPSEELSRRFLVDVEVMSERLGSSEERQLRLETEVLELEKSLSTAEMEKDGLSASYEQAIERLNSITSETEKLHAEVARRGERLSAASSESERLHVELATQAERLNTASSETERLREELEAQDARLSSALSDSGGLRGEIAVQSERLRTVETETEGLRRELAQKVGLLEEASQEYAQVRDELGKVEALAAERSEQVAELEQRLEEMRTVGENLQNEQRRMLIELWNAASTEG